MIAAISSDGSAKSDSANGQPQFVLKKNSSRSYVVLAHSHTLKMGALSAYKLRIFSAVAV